uniref:SKI-interacting protein SKIP SNW domain-containing protein n=2 Tax=Calcidiscus leptoporus TaxID=127549 RepID=A0A7S0NQI2_9EUKA
MAALILPQPRNVEEVEVEDAGDGGSAPAPVNKPPPQGARKGWIPRSQADFGDGGAFPEIHVAQYPLDMGRKDKKQSQVLALTTDGSGKARHDLIATVGQRDGKTVYSNRDALAPKQLKQDELARPTEEEAAQNTERTRLALEQLAAKKAAGVHGSLEKALADKKAPQYIKYTPSNQGSAQASGATNRVIRMVEAPVDPMEPPKFKHKRVPRGPPSPPVPVMHSPPRKVTVKDQQDWKIPPCISNWKNIKGYTIPLDKRLAADGRGLQEVQISDNFANLSEALYIAEQNAREEVEKRAQIQKKLAAKDKERKEDDLRALAQKARQDRTDVPPPPPPPGGGAPLEADALADAQEREALRMDRKRERERERRLENKDGKRSKMTRDAERDVSERIALGQAVPNSSETLYDQRLFNQQGGVANSLSGADDAYNIYDKALFRSGAAAESIYRPSRAAEDDWGDEDAAAAQVMKSARFKPGDKGFEGAGEQLATGGRGKPVEFAEEDEADPFGLDQFLSEAKKGKALDAIGQGGAGMSAAAGGSMGDSGRSRVDFSREGGR